MTHTISRRVAVVGIGETAYYRHGQAPVPEFLLAIEAIEKAAADAGLDVRELDGFCSYSGERSDPRGSAPRSVFPTSRSRTCSGAAEAAACAARSPTPRRRSPPGSAGTPWCIGRWRRDSSADSASPTLPATVSGTRRLHRAVRTDDAGAADRAAHAAFLPRAWRHRRGAVRGGARLLRARTTQSARRHVRPSAHARGVLRGALDRRAVPALRLLPGERRRRGGGADDGGASARPAPQAGAICSRRRRDRARGSRCSATPIPTSRGRTSRRWRRACTPRPASSRRTSTWRRSTRTSPARW